MKHGLAFAPCVPLSGANVKPTSRVTMRLPGGFGRKFRFDFSKGGGSLFGGSGGMFGGTGFGGVGGSGFGGSGRSRGAGGGTGAPNGPNNIFASLWANYNSALESKPILTKALTSLVGFFLGDLLAQKFLSKSDGAVIDKARLARMASFGFLFHGPTGHYFYNFLDRLIPGKTALNVASKVAIDQVLWAPVFTACFFIYLGIAERKSQQQIIDKVKNDTWTGVTTSWKFWPLAHAINFSLVPTQQRLLYINTLQVGYNMILSLIGNR